MKEKKNWLRFQKMTLLGVLDIVSVLGAYFLALLLRFEFKFSEIPDRFVEGYLAIIPFWCVVTVVVFFACRLYRSILGQASVAELEMVIVAYVLLHVEHEFTPIAASHCECFVNGGQNYFAVVTTAVEGDIYYSSYYLGYISSVFRHCLICYLVDKTRCVINNRTFYMVPANGKLHTADCTDRLIQSIFALCRKNSNYRRGTHNWEYSAINRVPHTGDSRFRQLSCTPHCLLPR